VKRRTANFEGRPVGTTNDELRRTAGETTNGERKRRTANFEGRPVKRRTANFEGRPVKRRTVNFEGRPVKRRTTNFEGRPVEPTNGELRRTAGGTDERRTSKDGR